MYCINIPILSTKFFVTPLYCGVTPLPVPTLLCMPFKVTLLREVCCDIIEDMYPLSPQSLLHHITRTARIRAF